MHDVLMPRHELKYFINQGDAIALAHKLRHVLARDRYGDENNEYPVRSLYFDDAYDMAYHDKIDGVMTRDKYRIRIYRYDDSVIYLERKRKMGDLIQKSSVRITRRLAEQLMRGDPLGLEKAEKPLLQDMYRVMRLGVMRPVVLVDYAREAYTHPAENVRITLDKRLRTALFRTELFDAALPTLSPLDAETVILEVKYDHYLPDYIASLLAGTPAQRSAISKYTLCRRFEPF